MFERMLIDKIENRILVGIVMFLGIMLLVGWVAINETARMSSFERQFDARAIERGARLFNTNCSVCHGIDARGRLEQAPGLNNPHLFGYDYFANINRQIASLNTQIDGQRAQLNDIDAELEALNAEALDPETTDERFSEIQARIQEISDLQAEMNALVAEAGDENTTEERFDEIQTRLGEIQATLLGDPEIVTQVAELEIQRAELFAQRDQLVSQFATAQTNGFPIEINDDGTVNQPARLDQMGWAGTLHDYIYTTLVHGRPGSANWWPLGQGGMSAWAQLGGGPLRADQVEDIVTYILNFEREWTVEDALAVNQFGRIPGSTGGIDGLTIAEEFPDATFPNIDYATVQEITAAVSAIEIDPATIESAYTPCTGCHAGGTPIGPPTAGTWDRVLEERLNNPQFAGYTGQEYLVESILHPSVYLVPGFESVAMPGSFSSQLTLEQLANIVAYLQTQTVETESE